MSGWPSWAAEQVRLAPSQEAWLHSGERECRLIGDALAAWLLAPVEHVGSTAVPGLPAKPILDLQAAVADPGECAPLIAEALAGAGWEHVPPSLDQRPWRRFFVKVVNGRRAAHLHVMTLASPRWNEQVAFRDALRADGRFAASYSALKQSLVSQHPNDREAYSAGKADFIRTVLDVSDRTPD